MAQSKNGFLPRNHTKKNKENETCPVKIDQVEAEIIFKKPCILIPNTSKNNYNMFLQQLKKLLSQNSSRRKQLLFSEWK